MCAMLAASLCRKSSYDSYFSSSFSFYSPHAHAATVTCVCSSRKCADLKESMFMGRRQFNCGSVQGVTIYVHIQLWVTLLQRHAWQATAVRSFTRLDVALSLSAKLSATASRRPPLQITALLSPKPIITFLLFALRTESPHSSQSHDQPQAEPLSFNLHKWWWGVAVVESLLKINMLMLYGPALHFCSWCVFYLGDFGSSSVR